MNAVLIADIVRETRIQSLNDKQVEITVPLANGSPMHGRQSTIASSWPRHGIPISSKHVVGAVVRLLYRNLDGSQYSLERSALLAHDALVAFGSPETGAAVPPGLGLTRVR